MSPVEAAARTARLTAEILRAPSLADLGLRTVAGESGFSRPVSWGRIQRPGLAFAGFLAFIKPGRIQILGESELHYLDTMPPDVRRERIAAICRLPVAAFVVTKGQQVPEDLARECRSEEVPLLVSSQTTSVVIQAITQVLEDVLAPSTTRARRARGRLRDGGAPHRRLGHRQERMRARPDRAGTPARRGRRRGDPEVPERLARGSRGGHDPLPHGAARDRHHQHQEPLRRLRGARLEVDRARHRARTLGPGQEVRPPRSRRPELLDPRTVPDPS